MTKLTFLENDDYRLVAAEDWSSWHILEASGVWELYNMNKGGC